MTRTLAAAVDMAYREAFVAETSPCLVHIPRNSATVAVAAAAAAAVVGKQLLLVGPVRQTLGVVAELVVHYSCDDGPAASVDFGVRFAAAVGPSSAAASVVAVVASVSEVLAGAAAVVALGPRLALGSSVAVE